MEHVHVIVYHDPMAGGCVGLDVFAKYDDAFRQFEETLEATEKEHPDDEDWIVQSTVGAVDDWLYFKDKSGYEVFYRKEEVQCGWHKIEG